MVSYVAFHWLQLIIYYIILHNTSNKLIYTWHFSVYCKTLTCNFSNSFKLFFFFTSGSNTHAFHCHVTSHDKKKNLWVLNREYGTQRGEGLISWSVSPSQEWKLYRRQWECTSGQGCWLAHLVVLVHPCCLARGHSHLVGMQGEAAKSNKQLWQ